MHVNGRRTPSFRSEKLKPNKHHLNIPILRDRSEDCWIIEENLREFHSSLFRTLASECRDQLELSTKLLIIYRIIFNIISDWTVDRFFLPVMTGDNRSDGSIFFLRWNDSTIKCKSVRPSIFFFWKWQCIPDFIVIKCLMTDCTNVFLIQLSFKRFNWDVFWFSHQQSVIFLKKSFWWNCGIFNCMGHII